MYDVIVYVRKVLWEEIKKHMVGVSSQICLRASLVKSGCFTDLETLQDPSTETLSMWQKIYLFQNHYQKSSW